MWVREYIIFHPHAAFWGMFRTFPLLSERSVFAALNKNHVQNEKIIHRFYFQLRAFNDFTQFFAAFFLLFFGAFLPAKKCCVQIFVVCFITPY